MKKISSLILALSMVFALSVTAIAAENTSSTNEELSNIYGIPMSVLETSSATTLSDLRSDLGQGTVVSSNDTYIKISYNELGDSIAQEVTYQEYVVSTRLRDTDQNSWMKVHTTIIDKGSYAQVSAAYTWLTRPAFRMRDVIGLSITQGTFIDNSADGFYTYSTSQGTFDTNFTSGFDYQGHGIVRNVTLAKPDYPTKSDFMFIRANIYKEGASEGLNGTYGHQRASISIAPRFTIDRNGILSAVGFNLGMTYDTFKGYTSIKW